MLQQLISGRALITAFLIAMVTTMFIGCFANAPGNMDESFSGKYWYYINRGYPDPFIGWTLQGTNVELPYVKLPFIVGATPGEEKLEKIIDLNRFAPLLLGYFSLAYLPSYLFAELVDKNKKLIRFWTIANAMLVAFGLFIYFYWFSRV